jgi:hypothetical protein
MSEDNKALVARLRNVSAAEWCEPLCAEAADALEAAEADLRRTVGQLHRMQDRYEAAEARVKELEELMEGTARYFDARSELFTSDADCAMYMAKKLRAALSTANKEK